MSKIVLLAILIASFAVSQKLNRFGGTKWNTEGANGGLQAGTLELTKKNICSFQGDIDGAKYLGKFSVIKDTLILNYSKVEYYDDRLNKRLSIKVRFIEKYLVKKHQLILHQTIEWTKGKADTINPGEYGGDCIFNFDSTSANKFY